MGRARRLVVLLVTFAMLVAGMALAPSALAATPPQLGIYSIVPLDSAAQIDVYPPTDENGTAIEGLTYQASLNGGTWTNFAVASNPDFGTLTGTITGLQNGTEYSVRVRAVDNGDEGPASDPPVSVTPGRPTAPSASVSPRDRSAVVSIFAPSSDGGSAVVSYDISVTTSAAARNWVDAQESEVDGAITSTRTGLTNGTAYYVAVRARNAGGPGPGSDPTRFVPGRPTAPNVNFVTAGDQSATISFSPPAETGGFDITGYEASATIDPSDRNWQLTSIADLGTDDSGSPTLTVNGLSNGDIYNVYIRAVNGNGPGDQSGDGQTVTPDAVPAAPTDVVATITPSNAPSVRLSATARITFTPPQGGGGTNPTDSTSFTVSATPASASGDVTCDLLSPCDVSGLTNGTTYTFTVTASNNYSSNLGITSDPSAASNPILPSGAPYPPRSIARAGAGPNSATVSFLPPYFSGRGVTGYQVSTNNGTTWRTVTARVSGSRRLVTATGLRSGLRYTIRVRAVNALGTGAYSAGLLSLTGPSIVTGRPVARAGTAGALVRWTASPEREVFGYYVVSSRGARCYTYTRTETSCIIGNTAGTNTSYRVYARSTSGSSYASATSNTVRASSPYVPSQLPGVPGGFRAVSKNVKTGKNATLIARGFLPSSSVVLVAYGAKRHVVKRFTANAAGNFAAVVKMPKDAARSLTFVAFGVTPYGSSKAIAASIQRG